MIKFKNRFEYVPQSENGYYLFEGKPCPTLEAYKILGDKGIKNLDQKIKQLITNREEIFGRRFNNQHGLLCTQEFIDKFKKAVFLITEIDFSRSTLNKFENLKDSSLKKQGNYIISLKDFIFNENDNRAESIKEEDFKKYLYANSDLTNYGLHTSLEYID